MKRRSKSSSRTSTSRSAIPKYIRDKVDKYNAATRKQKKLYDEIQRDIAKVNKSRGR